MDQFEGRTQSHVKIDNQRLILSRLYEQGPMSRADLAKSLNSSKPTVSKNVEGLLGDHRITEIGKGDNLVGKKAMLLDINPDYGYVVALDLSKEVIRIVLGNLKGEWLYKLVEPLEAVTDINGFLDRFVSNSKLMQSKVREVVIAYPGVVGHNDAYYLTNVQQKEAVLKELILELEARFHKKPVVKNDVNLGVIAQQQYGHEHHGNLYYISGDVGIGSGIILNHVLYEGDRNAAGEIGFILPSSKTQGLYHTLEERISVQALRRRYKHRLNEEVTFEYFCEQVKKGETAALALYEEVLSDFSVALTNVASILDIEHIVVTGRLFNILPSTVEELNQRVRDMTPFKTIIEQSKIEEPTLKGAVYIGIREMIHKMV